jgi:hypothetical protein
MLDGDAEPVAAKELINKFARVFFVAYCTFNYHHHSTKALAKVFLTINIKMQ